MADIHKYTSKEVLNKVLLDSSGDAVDAYSHTTSESLNAILDDSNSRINVNLKGGTISGDVTISGDLTVSGGGSLSFDEILEGTQVIDVTSTEALLVRKNGDGGDVFVVDTTNSRVGIGVTPAHTFHVHATSTTDNQPAVWLHNNHNAANKDGTVISSTNDGSDAEVLHIRANNTTYSNGTSLMLVRGDGNVGIGTASPLHSLSVGAFTGTVTGDTSVLIGGSGDTHFIMGEDTSNHGKLSWDASENSWEFSLTDGGSTRANALVIDQTGNVGIGTASPATLLHVAGQVTATGGAVSAPTYSFVGDTDTGISRPTTNSINLVTGGTERMRIDSSGNVGIGVTDPNNNLMVGSLTGGDIAVARTDTSINNGDTLGNILFKGKDDGGGGAYGIGAKITALATETWNEATAEGTSLNFYTTANSASANTLNMVLDANSRISLSNNDGGTSNTAFGKSAGDSLTTDGNYNAFFGEDSGTANTTGAKNTSVGYGALKTNTTTSRNSAFGYNALNVSVQDNNSAFGESALAANTSGNYGSAFGREALKSNTTGGRNSGFGATALKLNTTGADNTAVGFEALKSNTTGSTNVAVGGYALTAHTTGGSNVAVGEESLKALTTGSHNVGIGKKAMILATGSQQNTAIGSGCMQNVNGNYNTAVGYNAGWPITSGVSNTMIGHLAGSSMSTGDNNLLLGHDAGISGSPGGAISTADNTIVLGDENIANAHIQVEWSVVSDKRDKTDVEEMTMGLDFVNKLEPVTYRWDKRSKYSDDQSVSPDGTHKEERLDMGFLAQDVEKLEEQYGYKADDKTNLTTTISGDEKMYGLKYSKFVPILVKAIQELSAKVKALENA